MTFPRMCFFSYRHYKTKKVNKNGCEKSQKRNFLKLSCDNMLMLKDLANQKAGQQLSCVVDSMMGTLLDGFFLV